MKSIKYLFKKNTFQTWNNRNEFSRLYVSSILRELFPFPLHRASRDEDDSRAIWN